jgi:hypothetical protein
MIRRRPLALSLVAGLVLAFAGPTRSPAESMYVFGIHTWDWGADLDVMSWRTGWVVEASLAGDYGTANVDGRWAPACAEGFTIIQRLDWSWDQSIPLTATEHDVFAAQCAGFAGRIKRYCRFYSIGNEVEFGGVTPAIYATCFQKVRNAIRAVQPEAKVIIGHMCDGENQRQAIRLLGPDGYDGLTAHTPNSVPDGLLTMLDEENARPGVGVYITEWGWVAGTNPNAGSVMLGFCHEVANWNATHARQVYAACWYLYPWWIHHVFSLEDSPSDNAAFENMTATCAATNAYADNRVTIANVRVQFSASDEALVVRWDTDQPARTQLWFWNQQAQWNNGEFVPLQSSLVTQHQITLAHNDSRQTELVILCRSTADDRGDGNSGPLKVTTGPCAVTAADITGQAATIRWHTLFPATSRVQYGPTAAYDREIADPGLTADHELRLDGLTPLTTYHFRVWFEAPGYAPHHSTDLTFTTTVATPSDFDADGDVDLPDFSMFQLCFAGPNRPPAANCSVNADLDGDADVDLADFSLFQACFNGPNRPPACSGP